MPDLLPLPPCATAALGLPPAIARALTHIGLNLGQPLQLEELAAVAGLSIWRFSTVFRHAMGTSPHRYVCARRVERAEKLLRQGMSVARVASETGFYDQSHFSRHFKNALGLTPGRYRAINSHDSPEPQASDSQAFATRFSA
ncbi:helix-turn-helix domain-containing protein [Variovorax paradoxus]|uniref:Transposon Tn10 TetD protein n=1 Tax=Variovorax paradoxus TaxID=34073 RepID=A0A0H2MKY3_VARPD|nr:AraC family transcriptional regulator [Variovorax paradoxus]KLN57420.1 transposon Tn10 TetD protein [Variovorax paradoxus]